MYFGLLTRAKVLEQILWLSRSRAEVTGFSFVALGYDGASAHEKLVARVISVTGAEGAELRAAGVH